MKHRIYIAPELDVVLPDGWEVERSAGTYFIVSHGGQVRGAIIQDRYKGQTVYGWLASEDREILGAKFTAQEAFDALLAHMEEK